MAVLAGCIGLVMVMRLMLRLLSFFVNSSLARVLLFRRRVKSVADALRGIRHPVVPEILK